MLFNEAAAIELNHRRAGILPRPGTHPIVHEGLERVNQLRLVSQFPHRCAHRADVQEAVANRVLLDVFADIHTRGEVDAVGEEPGQCRVEDRGEVGEVILQCAVENRAEQQVRAQLAARLRVGLGDEETEEVRCRKGGERKPGTSSTVRPIAASSSRSLSVASARTGANAVSA